MFSSNIWLESRKNRTLGEKRYKATLLFLQTNERENSRKMFPAGIRAYPTSSQTKSSICLICYSKTTTECSELQPETGCPQTHAGLYRPSVNRLLNENVFMVMEAQFKKVQSLLRKFRSLLIGRVFLIELNAFSSVCSAVMYL